MHIFTLNNVYLKPLDPLALGILNDKKLEIISKCVGKKTNERIENELPAIFKEDDQIIVTGILFF